MKYKIGDEVRITRKISNHDFNIGDIVKIVDTDEQDNLQYRGAKKGEYSGFWFSGLECESITDSYDIHIESNGVYINYLYKKNGEIVSSSGVKLNQETRVVFDIKEGARLCIGRLENKEKYNGKVICIKSEDNPFFTIGRIYNVINGVFIGDCTSEWTNDDKYFYSLEEINDYFKDYDNVKFIKLVED
jgi:hypothetical protein